jgi:hypothetical protein
MNKRLMKLAGLLKEDINPYEDNNVEEEVAKFIKQKVEDEVANAAAQIDKLGKGTYCIYDVASSRGHQDATVVRRDVSKQEALDAIRNVIDNMWETTLEWAEDDEDVDETNTESMIDFLEKAGEFIGGTEGVQDYSGYSALEIGLAEESYLGIVHSKDKEEAEEDYGVYEDEMGDI